MWQKIAIGLLDIILEKREMWEMRYDEAQPYYVCLIYVNQRNRNRFTATGVDYESGKIVSGVQLYIKEPHELYKEKAKKLLVRILDNNADEWWD